MSGLVTMTKFVSGLLLLAKKDVQCRQIGKTRIGTRRVTKKRFATVQITRLVNCMFQSSLMLIRMLGFDYLSLQTLTKRTNIQLCYHHFLSYQQIFQLYPI